MFIHTIKLAQADTQFHEMKKKELISTKLAAALNVHHVNEWEFGGKFLGT